MRINKLVAGMTAAAALFALAGTANGDALFFRTGETGGEWLAYTTWEVSDDNVNWGAAGVGVFPGAEDIVYILTGTSVTVTADEAAAELYIDAGADVTVNSGESLTIGTSVGIEGSMYVNGELIADGGISVGGLLDIGGAVYANAGAGIDGVVDVSGSGALYSASGTTDINGQFVMSGANSILTLNNVDAVRIPQAGILQVEADARFDGPGSLLGQHNDAKILLCPDSGAVSPTLTNKAKIHGMLTIRKNPDNSNGSALPVFANGYDSGASRVGLVQADATAANSVILLHSSLASITDTASGSCSAPQWAVTAANSKLQFARAATSLQANFYVGPGTLMIDQNVTTSGKLYLASGGAVQVANGATFTFTGGYCSGSTCNATASPFVGPTTVSCP
jgi:hypothetical protein